MPVVFGVHSFTFVPENYSSIFKLPPNSTLGPFTLVHESGDEFTIFPRMEKF